MVYEWIWAHGIKRGNISAVNFSTCIDKHINYNTSSPQSIIKVDWTPSRFLDSLFTILAGRYSRYGHPLITCMTLRSAIMDKVMISNDKHGLLSHSPMYYYLLCFGKLVTKELFSKNTMIQKFSKKTFFNLLFCFFFLSF